MIYTIRTIKKAVQKIDRSKQTVVLVTGFFDLLHNEHINFLKSAKLAGDILIVGVESDARARAIKGEGRPIQKQDIRIKNLVPYCDYVIALGEDFDNPQAFESLIAAICPNFLAISSHTAHQDKKSTLVSKYGGELKIVYLHNPEISTSKIINQNKV